MTSRDVTPIYYYPDTNDWNETMQNFNDIVNARKAFVGFKKVEDLYAKIANDTNAEKTSAVILRESNDQTNLEYYIRLTESLYSHRVGHDSHNIYRTRRNCKIFFRQFFYLKHLYIIHLKVIIINFTIYLLMFFSIL